VTDDANPRHVYHDLAVAIDSTRNLYNGQPSLIARWLDDAGLGEGQRVVHVGCGAGYFTALMASVVGPTGRVDAVDVDAGLATQAAVNLAAWRWVSVSVGNGAARLASGAGSRWPVIASGFIAVALAGGGIYYASNSGAVSVRTVVLISLPILLAGLFAVMWSRFVTAALLAVGFGSVLTLGLVVRFVAVEFAQRQSTKALLAVADSRGFASAPLFIRRDDRSPEFYASSRVVYGSDGEPERLEAIKDIVAETKSRGQRILILVPLEDLDQYKNPTYIEIIGDNGTHALLATKLGK